MDTPLIYRDGRHYDLLYTMAGADVDYYLALARTVPGPILELACGTGKYVLPLALAGHRVVGIDLAQPMLDHATKKARRVGVAPSLLCADIRDFELNERFGLIVIAGNSIVHMHTLADLKRCLACVRAHLRPDGLFVIDVFVPDPKLLARDPSETFHFGEYDDPDTDERVRITYSQVYDPAAQLSRVTLYERRGDEAREITGELTLRMWYPCELEAALEHNGFHIVKRHGDHRGSAFSLRSGKQIVHCGLQSPRSSG